MIIALSKDTDVHFVDAFICVCTPVLMHEKRERERTREERENNDRSIHLEGEKREDIRIYTYQLYHQSVSKMARTKLISLSRLWYTLIIVFIHIILVYFGIKQCYFHERLIWPKTFALLKFELFFEKFCLIISLILLIVFIYPALFQIGNYANDNKQITSQHLKAKHFSFYPILWKYSFSLSSTLHLIMSFLILISTMLIHAKQFYAGAKDSGSRDFVIIQKSRLYLFEFK